MEIYWTTGEESGQSREREAILVIETRARGDCCSWKLAFAFPERAIALFETLQQNSRANSRDLAELPEKQKRR
jgi:hypothetical protein